MKLKLRTTLRQFETCHEALAKLRRGTERVNVPAEALSALLADHSRLTALLKGEVVEPH